MNSHRLGQAQECHETQATSVVYTFVVWEMEQLRRLQSHMDFRRFRAKVSPYIYMHIHIHIHIHIYIYSKYIDSSICSECFAKNPSLVLWGQLYDAFSWFISWSPRGWVVPKNRSLRGTRPCFGRLQSTGWHTSLGQHGQHGLSFLLIPI